MNKIINTQAPYRVIVDQAVTFDADKAVETARREKNRKINRYKMTQDTDSCGIFAWRHFKCKMRYQFGKTRGKVSV